MFLKSGVLLFIALFASYTSLDRLKLFENRLSHYRPEALYLPNGKGLEFISFGYKDALAHSIWFNAINYFGKHYRSDKDYKWLAHYCKITTNLSPKIKDYYQFCGTMLSWEAGRPDDAINIFSQAINAFPEDWLFYYLRGFTKAFFLDQQEEAKQDFILSASKPAANPIVVRLASKKIISSSGYEEAIDFLKNAIELAADPASKSILENRLEEVIRNKGHSTVINQGNKSKDSVRWRKEIKVLNP